MRPPLCIAVDLAAGAALVLLVALGCWWASDRARRWEPPRWGHGAFESIRSVTPGEPGAPELWVVATSPRCPRCLATIWRLHRAVAVHAARAEVVALLVDTPARPGAGVLRRLPPIPVWWDRENVWREKWGHRLYGELLQFDRSGRHLRTIHADDASAIDRRFAPRRS